MQSQKRRPLFVTLALSAVSLGALGVVACVAPAGSIEDEATASSASKVEAAPEAVPLVVTCTSDCSDLGGVSISRTCTTCSATNSSVTCDGVTTECAPYCPQPRRPIARCGGIGWQWCGCPTSDEYPAGWICDARCR
jgi:hypothetical protein